MQLPTKEQFEALHWAKVRLPGSHWRGEWRVAEACVDLGWLEAVTRDGGDELNPRDHVYLLTSQGREALAAYRAAGLSRP